MHCVWYGSELLCPVGECLLDTELCLEWNGITHCVLWVSVYYIHTLCLVLNGITVSCG